MEMTREIIFDMDGTIADLYSVEGWLEKLRAEDTTPYEIANPMVDFDVMNALLAELQLLGWKIVVTSWLAMNSTQAYKNAVRKAKRAWLAEMGMPIDEMHLVQYGTPKQVCSSADMRFLIDDSAEVRDSFANAEKGRFAINPAENDICDFLKNLIENF